MTDYGVVRDGIITLIEKKDVSLADFKQWAKENHYTRQAVVYNLKKLVESSKIIPYVIGTGLLDKERFFTIVKSYEDPKDILGLMEKIASKDKAESTDAIRQLQKLYDGISFRVNRPELDKLVLLIKSEYLDSVPSVKEEVALEIAYFRKYGDSINSLGKYYIMRQITEIEKPRLPFQDLSNGEIYIRLTNRENRLRGLPTWPESNR